MLRFVRITCIAIYLTDNLLHSIRNKVLESELTPAPTIPKFPTPTPQHHVNEVWLSIVLQQLAMNGNRGKQQEFSISIKVSKQIVPFQQEYPTCECDVKNNLIRLPESDKRFRHTGTDLGSAGPQAILVLEALSRCDLFGCFSEKRESMPLLCVVTPQKSIFCCAEFGFTFALDVQQKLRVFPTFF